MTRAVAALTSAAIQPGSVSLAKPDVAGGNPRTHCVHPLKEAPVHKAGLGLALEGASASALVKLLEP